MSESMMTKPRFILIDNALNTTVGHYYEYDVSVLASVPRSQYEALLFSNVDAPDELKHLSIPFFHCDFWAPSREQRSARMQNTRPAASDLPAQSAMLQSGKGSPDLAYVRYRQVVEWGKKLDRQYGHNTLARPFLLWAKRLFFWARAWRWRLNANIQPTVVGTPNPKRAPSKPIHLNDADKVLYSIFLTDLLELFQQYAVGPQDVLFFPNMNHWALAAIIDLAQQVGYEQLPKIKLLFRRNIFVGRPTVEQYLADDYFVRTFESLFDCLAQYPNGKLAFFTDTERLKAEYEVFSPFEFQVLPIPFRHDLIKIKSSPGHPFRVVYLGNARSEKGFQYLPRLVESISSRVHTGEVEFVFQAIPDPEAVVLEAIQKLKQLPGVTLLESPLTDREYYELLNSGDIMLILYDPVMYFSRSSCIFVESVLSATPFITLSGSWMTQVMAPGTGEVLKDISELPTALERVLDNYQQYHQAIRCASEKWESYHNPRKLVEILLSD